MYIYCISWKAFLCLSVQLNRSVQHKRKRISLSFHSFFIFLVAFEFDDASTRHIMMLREFSWSALTKCNTSLTRTLLRWHLPSSPSLSGTSSQICPSTWASHLLLSFWERKRKATYKRRVSGEKGIVSMTCGCILANCVSPVFLFALLRVLPLSRLLLYLVHSHELRSLCLLRGLTTRELKRDTAQTAGWGHLSLFSASPSLTLSPSLSNRFAWCSFKRK